MKVNSSAYPSNYHVSQTINGELFTIDFSDSFFTLDANGNIPLGSVMDSSNCYCGFNPAIHNLYDTAINQYCIESINPDNVYEFSSEIRHYRNIVNYRLCFNVGTRGGNQITRYTNLIANQDYFQPTNVSQNQYYVCTNKMGGYSTSYGISNNTYPITNIDLDKIVLYPEFLVTEIQPIYTDGVITSYSTVATHTYSYNDIKPADNTDAGANFDSDLWARGFKDTYENGVLVKRTMVLKCYLRAYIGTKSRYLLTYVNFNSSWNSDGNRKLPTGFSAYNSLTPLIEIYDDVTGSVIYKTIPYFSDMNSNITCNSSYQVAQTGATELYSTTYQMNTLTNALTNADDRILVDNRIDSKENSYKFISNLRNQIESFNIQENSSTEHYIFFFENTGEIMQTYRSGSTFNFVTRNFACYPLKDIVTAIASLGLFVAGNSLAATSTDITDLDNLPEIMYHGNIDSNGITDGTLIQGTGIKDLPTYEDIEYSPVNPDSGGGGDSESDTEEEGDKIPNLTRGFSGAAYFCAQYAMTRVQVATFGSTLWKSWADESGTPSGFWKNFKLFLSDGAATDTGSVDISSIMDFIVGLRIFPFDLSNFIHTNTDNVVLGRGVYPIPCAGTKKMFSSIVYIDCGSVTIPKFFNDFRDYENMNITVYLPFCGSASLAPGDVIGRSLSCMYAVDLYTGDCLANVWVGGTDTYSDNEYLYNVASVSGHMGALIPVTSTNSGQIAAQRISDASAIMNLISGQISGSQSAMLMALNSKSGEGFNSGILRAGQQAMRTAGNTIASGIGYVGGVLGRGAIDAPSISGGSGLASFFCPASPYIQVRHGIYKKPENYNHSVGKVSTSSGTLGSFSGFTVCHNVDVSSLSCSDEEKAEVKRLLESGVYL